MATLFRVSDRTRRAVILASAAAAALLAPGIASAADIPTYIAPAPAPAAPMPVTPAAVPTFYVNVSALYMTRRDPAADALIITNETDPADEVTLLDASDLNFNWRPGLQVRAGTTIGGGNFGIEFGGFWLAPMTATVESTYDGPAYLPTTTPTELDLTDGFTATGTTALHGADVNATFALGGGVRLFAGLAYMNLNDQLSITANTAVTDPTYAWEVNNRMIGPQIGVNAALFGGSTGFFVDATARAGLLFNSITSTVDDGVDTGDNIERARTLMLGGGVTAGYNINENFSITAGYQATFLRNVGLATDQVGVTGELGTGGGAIALETATGNFLAHGVTLGVNLAF